MSRNVQGTVWSICLTLVLIAALSVLASCGGGGGGGGGGAVLPGAFGLTAPVDNDTGVALSQTLSWESSSGVVTYTIEVTTDSTFGSITTYSSTTIPAGTTSVVVSGLSPSTVYYWRVVAVNTAGSTMASGAPYSFTTARISVPAPAPGAFNLVAPAANDVSIPLSPTLVWGSSSNVSTYTVQVTTDSSFNTITAYENTTVPVGTTSVVVSGMSPSTVYYWRVIAVNAVGSTIASGAPYGFTTKRRGDVQWSATSQPSSFSNNAFGMKLNGTNLYLAGYDTTPGSGQLEWRMEKRSMADGGLIAGFGPTGVVVSNPTDTLIDAAYSVAIDSNHLYVAGYDSIPGDADQEWRIEKRDLGTGALITSFGTKSGAVVQNNSIGLDDRAESIAVDSSPSGTIYAAGFVRLSPTDREWRIEARDKATGLVVTSVTSSISAGNDAAHAIVIDEAEGYMYVAGSDASLGSTQWRIEKRSLSGVLALETGTFGPGYILSDYGTGADVPWAIALDANYLYIAGEVYDTTSNFTQWRIEKRSRTNGALIWEKISATGTDGVAHAIAVDGTHVYAAGFDTTAGGVIAWRIEKRDIVTGNLDSSFGSGGVVVKTLGEDVFGTPTPLDSDIWAIAVDNAYIYVAGSEGWPNVSGSRWRIEKIVK